MIYEKEFGFKKQGEDKSKNSESQYLIFKMRPQSIKIFLDKL